MVTEPVDSLLRPWGRHRGRSGCVSDPEQFLWKMHCVGISSRKQECEGDRLQLLIIPEWRASLGGNYFSRGRQVFLEPWQKLCSWICFLLICHRAKCRGFRFSFFLLLLFAPVANCDTSLKTASQSPWSLSLGSLEVRPPLLTFKTEKKNVIVAVKYQD